MNELSEASNREHRDRYASTRSITDVRRRRMAAASSRTLVRRRSGTTLARHEDDWHADRVVVIERADRRESAQRLLQRPADRLQALRWQVARDDTQRPLQVLCSQRRLDLGGEPIKRAGCYPKCGE